VAREFVQQEGVDFDDTFALVARMESICLLLARQPRRDGVCTTWMSSLPSSMVT
jgi:hypothetical protein